MVFFSRTYLRLRKSKVAAVLVSICTSPVVVTGSDQLLQKISVGVVVEQNITPSSESFATTATLKEPPPTEADDPRSLVHYFCRAWKDECFEDMYGAMSSAYRQMNNYEVFKRRFLLDIDLNGGLNDYHIDKSWVEAGSALRIKIRLFFKSISAQKRIVVAELVETSQGYRLKESGIIPLDLSDF